MVAKPPRRLPNTPFYRQFVEIERTPQMGPFIFRGRIGKTWHVITPSHMTRRQARETLSLEQYEMWSKASREIFHLRQRVYDLRMRNYMAQKQYELIREFMRSFMMTPREEEGKVVYRIPTMDELNRIFPNLKQAIIQRELDQKKTRDDVFRRSRPKK